MDSVSWRRPARSSRPTPMAWPPVCSGAWGGGSRCRTSTRWGFRLVGATLLATGAGTAVQLAYADFGGGRVSCLFQLRPAGADAGLRYREADGVVTAFGADSDLGYAMTARLPRRDLAAIAGEVYGRDDP